MKQLAKILIVLGLIIFFTSIYAQTRQDVKFPQPGKSLVLTLKDAVLLAVRNNPDVVSGELDRISQKYALLVAKNDFEPQYTLTGDAYYSPEGNNGNNFSKNTTYDFSPAVSLKTHYGTTFTLSSYNSVSGGDNGGYSPSLALEVEQPLIQGFGKAVVMASLNDAIDTEEINKLALKTTVISTITTIVSDYMQVVQANYQLQVDKQSLKDYEQTVANDKKMIAAGRMARTEIVQAQAQVATQKSTVQNDMNTIHQNKLTLLKDLGLDPDANVVIPDKIDFKALINTLTGGKGKTLPDLGTCRRMALQSDPSYQTEGISMQSLRRDLITAKDQQRWELDLRASESLGGNITTTTDVGPGGITESNPISNSYVGLELTIPINDMSKKQAVIDARIGLEKAQMQYQQQKRDIEKTTEDNLNTVLSNQTQLKLSRDALRLQTENMKISRRKYQVGRISTFELIKNQQDLTTAQQSVLTEQIDLINALVSLNQSTGTTLDNWGVKIKY